MKLLLTGSTGFIGRSFLIAALRSGRYDEIFLPVRSKEKLNAQLLAEGFETVPNGVTPLEGSAYDWNIQAIGEVDDVVHTAAALFASSRQEYFETNVEGTVRLLETCRGASRYVILSSQAAGGPCEKGMQARTESDSDSPLTWYGQSKLEMERRILHEFSDLNYLILRPPMILGPRDKSTLPLFKMVQGPLHFKPGIREKYYSYLSVNDLVSAIAKVLEHPADYKSLSRRCFYAASRYPISDKELLCGTSKASQSWGVIVPVPEPLLRLISQVVDRVPRFRMALPSLSQGRVHEILPDRWVVSSEEFCRFFGWEPHEPLPAVLKATYDWYCRSGQLRPFRWLGLKARH
jgi:nucleoside-diphosphate-sugar epimerase